MEKFARRKKSWAARRRRRRSASCLHAQQQESASEVIEVEVNGVRQRSGVLIKKRRCCLDSPSWPPPPVASTWTSFANKMMRYGMEWLGFEWRREKKKRGVVRSDLGGCTLSLKMHGNLEQLIPIARHELCSREYQQELNAGCSQIGSIPDGVELELPGDGSDPVPLRVYFFWSLAWCGFVHAYEQAALHAIRFL
ncbi:hypothetical protein CFC21_064979 [Triticum aestivum]|uniref:Uncharacterized protein n=2 Tax=Triticum aestivum TaxID=4565 RepID=A0A9R1H3L5_WHEAT|nr:hypothetical protein CFC21_064979 [Triticum aestivum]